MENNMFTPYVSVPNVELLTKIYAALYGDINTEEK